MLGDLSYYASDLNEPLIANWQDKLTWTLAASFLNETPLQGFEPLIAITNGDTSGWNRIVANTTRSMLPLSGGAGVLANAIDSAQKDLNGEIHEYIANRLPFFKNTLANQVDIWTGEPLNDINHPLLKILNALSPFKVSGTQEPWRQFLMEIQYTGMSRLKKDSSGAYEYTPKERELINQYIGEMKLYKEIQKMMKNSKYREEIKLLKNHRNNSVDLQNDRLKIDNKHLPIHKAIDRLINNAQKIAEARLLRDRPDIVNVIRSQAVINSAVQQGNIDRAIDVQKDDLDKQKLIQFGGSR